jgi:uncharacterized membrane protein
MAWVTIVLLWAAFAATHMGVSSVRLRPRLVERLGEGGFVGLYSLVALAIFIPLVSTYFGHKHTGPMRWYAGAFPGIRYVMYAGMGLAFSLVAGGLLRPSPAAFVPGRAEASGIYRVTRHPLFMGAGVFGLVHLLVVPVNAAELAFFGGFPIFAIAGCLHQDRRKLLTAGGEFERFHAETPFLPSLGASSLRAIREQPIAIGLGVATAVVLRVYHSNLFG